MTDQDKIGFMKMLNAVMELYSHPALPLDTVRVWYSKMEKYNFQDVCKAFDTYTTKYSTTPSPADIIRLIPQTVQFTQLPAPKLSKDENKEFSERMLKAIDEAPKPTTDMRAWAKRIIANPKNYPAISLKTAKEALHAN